MKERPILFSAPMVRAILDGRKTQTRRVIKPQPSLTPEMDTDAGIAKFYDVDECIGSIRCPYGVPGDRLWVRESFYVQPEIWALHRGPQPLDYAADVTPDQVEDYAGKPSIHMPRWASRISLEITDVRVQRVQEISDEDAIAEGYGAAFGPGFRYRAFDSLWDSIHGSGAWERNEWVWAVTFKPIDARSAA